MTDSDIEFNRYSGKSIINDWFQLRIIIGPPFIVHRPSCVTYEHFISLKWNLMVFFSSHVRCYLYSLSLMKDIEIVNIWSDQKENRNSNICHNQIRNYVQMRTNDGYTIQDTRYKIQDSEYKLHMNWLSNLVQSK